MTKNTHKHIWVWRLKRLRVFLPYSPGKQKDDAIKRSPDGSSLRPGFAQAVLSSSSVLTFTELKCEAPNNLASISSHSKPNASQQHLWEHRDRFLCWVFISTAPGFLRHSKATLNSTAWKGPYPKPESRAATQARGVLRVKRTHTSSN